MSTIGYTDDISNDAVQDYRPSFIEILDYIPLVSIISGLARAIFGFCQAIVGIIALPFQLAGRVVTDKNPLLIVQGLGNICRGLVASKPIIGNICVYIYDHSTVFKHDLRRAAGLEM